MLGSAGHVLVALVHLNHAAVAGCHGRMGDVPSGTIMGKVWWDGGM